MVKNCLNIAQWSKPLRLQTIPCKGVAKGETWQKAKGEANSEANRQAKREAKNENLDIP